MADQMAGSEPDPLKQWQARLAYLQAALAQSSDPAQKFGLEQQITEAEGWVARLSAPPGANGGDRGAPRVDLTHLPPGAEHFLARGAELAALDAAWAPGSGIAIVVVVAAGGTGKTALGKRWLLAQGAAGWGGAGQVFGWSFYSQGTGDDRQASEDLFLATAIARLGIDIDPAANPADKGQAIAERLGARRTLLILDGVEPLQYPPGGPLAGELRAPGLKALLTQLAGAGQPGLCVVTTREWLADLTEWAQPAADQPANPPPPVRRIELGNLSEQDGAALLHARGANRAGAVAINADDPELRAAGREVQGHALTLSLLGRYLARAKGGDIRQRDAIDLASADRDARGHAGRVIAAYEAWFARAGGTGARPLAALRLLGFFDRPAAADLLAALRAAPPIAGLTEALFEPQPQTQPQPAPQSGAGPQSEPPAAPPARGGRGGLLGRLWPRKPRAEPVAASAPPGAPQIVHRPISDTDWTLTLRDLAECGLIQFAAAGSAAGVPGRGAPAPLDAHPLVREVLAAALAERCPDAWREGHRRLYERLKTSAPHRPDGLAGLQPLYQAVAHGCQAGLWQEVLEQVYDDRILRGSGNDGFYSTRKLGAIGADLGAVACLFAEPWSRPAPALTASDQAWLLNQAAFRLRALGRLGEALAPMRVSGEMDEQQGAWKGAAISYGNLSALQLTLGRVADAVADARRAVVYADRSGDAFERMADRTALADALHQQGDTAPARAAFAEAEAMQAEDQPQYPRLYSLPGFRYCDLLLAAAERAAWCAVGRGDAGDDGAVGGAVGGGAVGSASSGADGVADADAAGATESGAGGAGVPAGPTADCAAVAARATETLRWYEAASNASLLDIALDHLTLARCALYADRLAGRRGPGPDRPRPRRPARRRSSGHPPTRPAHPRPAAPRPGRPRPQPRRSFRGPPHRQPRRHGALSRRHRAAPRPPVPRPRRPRPGPRPDRHPPLRPPPARTRRRRGRRGRLAGGITGLGDQRPPDDLPDAAVYSRSGAIPKTLTPGPSPGGRGEEDPHPRPLSRWERGGRPSPPAPLPAGEGSKSPSAAGSSQTFGTGLQAPSRSREKWAPATVDTGRPDPPARRRPTQTSRRAPILCRNASSGDGVGRDAGRGRGLWEAAMVKDKVLISIAVANADGAERLPGALTVANEMVEWGKAAGFKADPPVTDGQEPVTVARLKHVINPLLADSTRVIDHLLVHFAGHGFIRDQEHFLLLSDWSRDGDEAIALSEFRERLCDYPLKRITIVFDACSVFDSQGTKRVKGSGVVAQSEYKQQGPVDVDSFFASSEGEAAFMLRGDASRPAICLFSAALLHALSGVGLSSDKVRTQDVVRYVREKVAPLASEYNLNVRPQASGTFQPPLDDYASLPIIGYEPPELPKPKAAKRQMEDDLDEPAGATAGAGGGHRSALESMVGLPDPFDTRASGGKRGAAHLSASIAKGLGGVIDAAARLARALDQRRRRNASAKRVARPTTPAPTPIAAALRALGPGAEVRSISADLAIVGGDGRGDPTVLRRGADLIGVRFASGLLVPLYGLPGLTTVLYLDATGAVAGPLAITWRPRDAQAQELGATLELLIRLADNRLLVTAETEATPRGGDLDKLVNRQPTAALVLAYLADSVGDWRRVAAFADAFERVFGGLPVDLTLLARRTDLSRRFGLVPLLAAGWRRLGRSPFESSLALAAVGDQRIPLSPFVGFVAPAAEQFIVAIEVEA